MALLDRAQVRAARALLGWSQEQLAEVAGVSVPTIKRLETGTGSPVTDVTANRIRNAFESCGIAFTGGDLKQGRIGIGVELKVSPEIYATRFLHSLVSEQIDNLDKAMTFEADEERRKSLERIQAAAKYALRLYELALEAAARE